jgi:hypothetical protein
LLYSHLTEQTLNKIWSDRENHFILIKGTTHYEETIVNICASNISVPNFIKQIQLGIKAQIDASMRILGDFKTSLLLVHSSLRQKNQ